MKLLEGKRFNLDLQVGVHSLQRYSLTRRPASVFGGEKSFLKGSIPRECVIVLDWIHPWGLRLVGYCIVSVSADFTLWMLVEWVETTRLETRTKESNMFASIWVLNPDAQ